MISRLTAAAAVFAVLATAGLTFTAEAEQRPAVQRVTLPTENPVVTMPMVIVTGHRDARN